MVTVGVGPGVDVTGTCDVEKMGVAVVGKILVEGKLWERAGVAVVMGTTVDDGAGVWVRVVVIAIMVVSGTDVVLEITIDAGSKPETDVGIDVVVGGVEDGPAAIAYKTDCQILGNLRLA